MASLSNIVTVNVEVTNMRNPLIDQTFQGWTVALIEHAVDQQELTVEVDRPPAAPPQLRQRYRYAHALSELATSTCEGRAKRYPELGLFSPEETPRAVCYAVAQAVVHHEEDALLRYADVSGRRGPWWNPWTSQYDDALWRRPGTDSSIHGTWPTEQEKRILMCGRNQGKTLTLAAYQEREAARMFLDGQSASSMETFPCEAGQVFNRGDLVYVGASGLLRHAMSDDQTDPIERGDFIYDPMRMLTVAVKPRGTYASLPYSEPFIEPCNGAADANLLAAHVTRERRCGPLPQNLAAQVPLSAVPRPEARAAGRSGWIEAEAQRKTHLAAALGRIESQELARWKRTHSAWPLCRLGGVINLVWLASTDGSRALGVFRCSKCDNQGEVK